MSTSLVQLALAGALFAVPASAVANATLQPTALTAGQTLGDLAHAAPVFVGSNTSHEGHSGHGNKDATAAMPDPVIVGDLRIEASWTRATPPGARVGAGYLIITNTGEEPDVLVGGSAPFASFIEVHEMSVTDGTMRMRPIEGGLVIAPGVTETLQPGGNHVMFMGLIEGIEEGSPVVATLEFERAGTVELMFTPGPMGGGSPFVGDAGAHGGGHSHSHGGHSHSN
ncbi:MAG: copper chaperone PCu(A)C [Pseudomonadota bacterium]